MSSSFRDYIEKELGNNEEFNLIIREYTAIQLHYTFTRQELPTDRHSSRSTKDLIWVAASNSTNTEDFSQRITGYLPHSSQVQLIEVFNKVEPFYDELIWDKEQENIKRIEEQIAQFKSQIAQLFMEISQFYGTTWDTSIPFKISLYPIPLEKGNTTATPKGNALICGFLSKNDGDFVGRLAVIIHEMCHILYDEQPPALQHQIDSWFKESESEYSKLAYSYLNEGLATTLGNGWAYKQIHTKMDTTAWYNNEYINGFAYSLFELSSFYFDAKQKIDKAYINQAIDLFAKTFPKAINETHILMNELQLYANSEENNDIQWIVQQLNTYFNIRSRWFSTPINHPQSIQGFGNKQITKFFIVEKDHANSIKLLNEKFPNYELKLKMNSIETFKDNDSKSPVFVVTIKTLDKLEKALEFLAKQKYIEFGKSLKIE